MALFSLIYLIINETCAGVNLISMSMYAVGFSWIMGTQIGRRCSCCLIIPLSVIFNGLRITIIFCLVIWDQALRQDRSMKGVPT